MGTLKLTESTNFWDFSTELHEAMTQEHELGRNEEKAIAQLCRCRPVGKDNRTLASAGENSLAEWKVYKKPRSIELVTHQEMYT